MNKCPIVSRVTLIIPVPINHKISYPRMPIQPILILIAITLVNCARTRITYVNSALAEFVIFIFSTYSARSFIARLASRIRPAASRTRVPSREIGERFLLGDRSFTITNQRYLKFLQFNSRFRKLLIVRFSIILFIFNIHIRQCDFHHR